MQPTRIEWPLLLALGDRSSIPCIMNDLEIVKKEMDEDIVFVMEGDLCFLCCYHNNICVHLCFCCFDF